MTLPDLINGAFEICGGLFVAISVVKLHREKVVRGVSAVHVSFFLAWGLWNPFYYSGLEQWASFWGGIGLVTVNIIWLGQMIYYNTVHKRALAAAIKQGDRFWWPKLPAVGDRMQADQFGGFDRTIKRVMTTTPRYRHADK